MLINASNFILLNSTKLVEKIAFEVKKGRENTKKHPKPSDFNLIFRVIRNRKIFFVSYPKTPS